MDKMLLLYAFVFFVSFTVTVMVERRLIPLLKLRAEQPIYAEGPSWHKSKQGTPTMGGVAFLLAITLSLWLAGFVFLRAEYKNEAIIIFLISGFAVLNGLVGIIDDIKKLKRRINAGLTPLQKLLLQLLISALFLYLRYKFVSTSTELSFGKLSIDLGFLYYPLCVLLLLGITNCANLTDGVDGLASSVALSIGAALFFVSAFAQSSLAVISTALVGGALGFLFFNINPAKIFMGDTGSLFFGALISGCAFLFNNPLVILLFGGIYVIEGASVILQVLWYKATKKRIFKMAPLHHHLERCGFCETKICLVAMIVTFLLSLPAFLMITY